MPIINSTDELPQEATNWPRSLPFPKDCYPTRIIDSSFALSKEKQTPYIQFKVEIYAAPNGTDRVKSPIDGKEYVVAGTHDYVNYYLTPKALFMIQGLMKLLDVGSLDTDNPNHEQFRGKCFSASWGYEERATRKDLTEADRAIGKKEGDVVMREDGTPIKYYVPKCGQPQGKTKVPAPVF